MRARAKNNNAVLDSAVVSNIHFTRGPVSTPGLFFFFFFPENAPWITLKTLVLDVSTPNGHYPAATHTHISVHPLDPSPPHPFPLPSQPNGL